MAYGTSSYLMQWYKQDEQLLSLMTAMFALIDLILKPIIKFFKIYRRATVCLFFQYS